MIKFAKTSSALPACAIMLVVGCGKTHTQSAAPAPVQAQQPAMKPAPPTPIDKKEKNSEARPGTPAGTQTLKKP